MRFAHALVRDTLAARPADEPVIDTVRRAILTAVEKFADEPALFLTRSRLVASVPAAHARNLYLETDYEDSIAEAVAADRDLVRTMLRGIGIEGATSGQQKAS